MNNEGRQREQFFDITALFDWKFTRFITVDLVKVLYLVGIALLALGALAFGISGFSESVVMGLFTLIIAPIMFVIWVLFLRVYLELIVALFKIAHNTSAMAKRMDADAVATPQHDA